MNSPSHAGRTLGHFLVLESIGAGGMGVVYRARDQRLQRDVALKLLSPERFADEASRKRFRNEALALSRINHPNIASIYEFDSQDGVDFLVMELITGQTLAQKLNDGALSENETLHISQQILEALREAHHLGVIHRDLKPSNVLLTESGRVKILDFGLSIVQKSTTGATTISAEGLEDTAGTLPYMAPEILQGKPCDARTDIWSTGVVMYEMASGARPFKGKNAYELTSAIVASEPAALPTRLSAKLHNVVSRCLAKDPSQRYQTAGEVEAALASNDQVRVAVPSRSGRIVSAAFVFALLALLAGFGWRRHAHASSDLPAEKQLAILSLNSPSDSSELIAFGDGLDETLASRLTSLTRTNNLQVIPTSEVRSAGVTNLDEANQEFGANLGLEIGVRRSGNEIRVSYNLVDAKTHRQLRGDTITSSASDPFALEDKVSASIIDSLQLELGPEDRAAAQKHGTTNAAAFDLYLQGRGGLTESADPTNLDKSIDALKRAIELDPQFSLAYASLGRAYLQNFNRTHDGAFVEKASVACHSAIDSDSSEAEAYICLGNVLQSTGQYPSASDAFLQAEKLDPTSDTAVAGGASAYESLNMPDKAEATYRRAIGIRPQDSRNYTFLGSFYVDRGRYSDALVQFQKVVEIAPDNYNAYTNVAAIQMYQGDYAAAIATLQKSIAIRKTSSALSNLASAYFLTRKFDDAATAGRQAIELEGENYGLWGNLADAYYYGSRRADAVTPYEKASELVAKSLEINPRDGLALVSLASYQAMLGRRDSALLYAGRAVESSPSDPEVFFDLAQIYNQLGDQQEALRWLKKSLDAGFSLPLVENTASLDNLRSNGEYQRLISADRPGPPDKK
jgi:serine/threonine protein kinase/tetratricopeptide (TPR) repeat protein